MKKETTKEKIIRRLTSRKLWAAICGFITLVMAARGFSEQQAAQVAAIIMAGATVISYIVGEGMVDAAAAGAEKEAEEEKKSLYSGDGTCAFGFAVDDGGEDE